MSGRTAAAAAQRYLASLRLVFGCITPPILVAGHRFSRPNQPNDIALRSGLPVRLRADTPLYFRATQSYLIAETTESTQGRWAVFERGYNYTFEAGEPRRELAAFHWHPEPNQFVRYPHVHLGPAAGERLHGLDKAHIPTGQLTVSDIVHFSPSPS